MWDLRIIELAQGPSNYVSAISSRETIGCEVEFDGGLADKILVPNRNVTTPSGGAPSWSCEISFLGRVMYSLNSSENPILALYRLTGVSVRYI